MLSVKAFVGLGANLGEPEAQVRRALTALEAIPGTRFLAASSFYRSAPVGVGEQPDFINAVAAIETRLSARALLDELLAIEARFGRRRESTGAPRTLDLDLLLYGDRVIDEPGLIVPHPRMHERAFVLAPLTEIAPDVIVPRKGPVAMLLAACKDQKVEKIRGGGAPMSAETLLETLRQLAAELHPARQAPAASLDGRLDHDYGFDSLGRVELFLRLERRFGVSLPQSVMANAETPRDLLRAIHSASPASRRVSLERASALAEESATPERAATLIEVLEWHVARHPERPHIVLQDDSGEEQTVTYAALQSAARAVAAGLLDRDLQPGGAVAIMLPTGVDYFYSFFGVLLAGGVPVPIYPPARASQIEEHLRRHAGILSNALAEMLITVPEAKPIALLLKPRVSALKSVVTPAELARPGPQATTHRVKPQDIAMLQYTSGSTGNPKGVVLTHANLLANIRAMGRALRVTPEDVFVSWLPLYHDMGLIGAWMGSLVYGFKYPVMSPLSFLARPQRWLWTIHRHRGTLSGGPNFCYELALRKVEDADLEGLDLSSWRFAFNGAEPVSPDTMAAFSARFARYGFKAEAMNPCYGLAEATLGVSFTPPGRGAKLDRVERDTFTNSGRANPTSDPGANALTFVACGRPLPGHQVRVVDAYDRELAEREEGHLQFSGPSATSGYYRNPEATRELLHGEWIDTGDFGYIAEGEIHITGRVKDTIIRAGRNLYPYELEEAVGALEGVRKGCVAVFGAKDARSGTERVVVLAETRVTDVAERDRLRARIDALAVTLIGMPADEIVFAPPHSVLKTSSGKIRRAASRAAYERGALRGTRAVWWQIVRLAFAAILPQARRSLRSAADLAYGAWALALLGAVGSLTWIGCALLPRPAWCWRLSSRMCRIYLTLAGIRLSVRGLEHLPADRACVIAVNHASFIDGPVVLCALPRPMGFIAKRELLEHFVSRIYLKRIGTKFVERFDAQRGVEDTERFVEAVRAGRSLIVFPEGTFRRAPGLLPFHMGAFVVAAQTGTPVVPLTLRGTRSVLREGQWLFRRGAISATLGAPIEPAGTDWDGAIALRNRTRAEILRLCAEPDLGEETEPAPKSAA
jgi:2-amino-4-hydroxy-6-hydroxymethyldihydropteridine diphosphokinase